LSNREGGTLILGVGNTLMGDEGVGVRVIEHLEGTPLPDGVRTLDGGTGGLVLLGPMQEADKIVLVDATLDDRPAGTVRKLRPRFSKDYPRTLTAHDIGLKDLLDAFYLTGRGAPDVTLFAVSIQEIPELSTELSPEIQAVVPEVARQVLDEVGCT
jgi:hydrogenase maturation protease